MNFLFDFEFPSGFIKNLSFPSLELNTSIPVCVTRTGLVCGLLKHNFQEGIQVSVKQMNLFTPRKSFKQFLSNFLVPKWISFSKEG